ncbi:MAG: hypothetical protein ACFFCM_02605, partial [Promethearchaeota archaeon]
LYALGVYVSGDYAFVSTGGLFMGGGGLEIINITDPNNLSTMSTVSTSADVPLDAGGIWVSGNYAYIASGSGLCIIDITDPTNPGNPVYQSLSSTPYDVVISGNYAYVADGNSGLAVVKIGEIIDPRFSSWKDTSGSACGVFISGDYAYIADESQGLAIIDISDLTNPGTPIYKNTTGTSYRVFVSGNFAYLADGSNGLTIINITDPENPGNPINKSTTGPAADLFISGNYAYIAAGSSGLAIIDISDPTSPGNPVFAVLSFTAVGIFVSGNYAFLVGGAFPYGYLAIVDISNPTSPGAPIILSSAPISTIFWDVFISGDYAYIADGGGTLTVVDVSDPRNPGAPNYDFGSGSVGVFVSGDIAYLAEAGYPSLTMVDISNPISPSDYRHALTYAEDVYVDGDYTFVAAASNGLLIFKTMIPWYVLPAPTVNSISPNPSTNGSINVTWNSIMGADNYLVYRDSSPITSITGRTPIASTSDIYYNETQTINGTYYYAIVANNSKGMSIISNSQSVVVAIPPEKPPISPGSFLIPPIIREPFNIFLILIPIIIGGVAVAIITSIILKHRSSSAKKKPRFEKMEYETISETVPSKTKPYIETEVNVEPTPSISQIKPSITEIPLDTQTEIEVEPTPSISQTKPSITEIPLDTQTEMKVESSPPETPLEGTLDLQLMSKIQEESIPELKELVRNFKSDILHKYGYLTKHVESVDEWIIKLKNYPLSKLTVDDVKNLALMIDKWEKLLQ